MNKVDMGSSPLVSVVVPTFNRPRTVVKAIDSIVQQSYPRVEVIVVDDGSTDNTIEVLKDAHDRDPKVFYYHNTGDKGCAGARNTGISVARGEYVTFLDDDDEYCPDKIRTQVETFLANPEVDVLVSGVPLAWCSEGNRRIGWARLEFHPNRIFDGCFIMCKRVVLERISLRCNYMEWRDFAFQVFEKGCAVLLSSENLVRRNDSTNSLSKNQEQMFSTALSNAKSYYECSRGKEGHDVFRSYLANCYKNWGNYSLKRGRVWSAIGSYANSYRTERRIRNLVPFA